MVTIPPNAGYPISSENGKMTQAFRAWTQLVSLSSPLTGTGSPEGAVEARQTQLYMDITGVTGSILYIKRDADIGGDRKQGWVLV